MVLLDLNSAVVHADPYPHYRRLRDQAPMLFDAEEQRWLVTGDAEVIAILHDPRLSVQRVAAFAIHFSGMGDEGEQIAAILARWLSSSMNRCTAGCVELFLRPSRRRP